MSVIEDLKDKNAEIFHNQIKDVVINASIAILYITAFGAIVVTLATFVTEGFTTIFFGALILSIIFIISIKIISPYQKQYVSSNSHLYFRKFYIFFEKINSFNPYDNEDVKKVQHAAKNLAYEVSYWAGTKAPSAVQIIPKSISETLTNDVVNLLASKDADKIEKFAKYWLHICHLISKREPTHSEWINICKNFIHLSTERPIEFIDLVEIVDDTNPPILRSTKLVDSFPLQIFIKNPIISGLFTFVILFTMLGVENNWMELAESAVKSVTSAALVIAAAATLKNPLLSHSFEKFQNHANNLDK